MYERMGLFIDGAWRAKAAEMLPVVDPATGEPIGAAASATAADSEAAIVSAQRGLNVWRGTPAWVRADILHNVADVMLARTEDAAQRITLEAGKPIAQSRREWQLCIDQFRWHAEEARRIYGRVVESRVPGGRLEVSHEPIGIVAAFTAWNFPAVLIARKAAPALAAGCSIIIRPSRETPGVAMVVVDCLRAACMPAGVVNLLLGPTSTTYAPIMASPKVRKVSLTGSTAVGQQMIRDAAATLKRTTMELGGNAPVIICDDFDVEAALDICVPAKFANAGQVCVTGDRFYVQQDVYSKFVAGFAARAKALKLGHGLDDATQMGPLINQRRIDAIAAVVADARKAGGTINAGGGRPAGQNKGFFFEPTVISNIPDSAKALAEENFGPIAAITPFKSTDEAYARANACDRGLSAYVFTRDPKRQREAVARIESGMVGVNSFALAAAEAPFGGIKASGTGREGGTEAIHDYMNVKLAQIVL
jgi:succinate-semialdehyde dehydrogenase/glutarate-semialdehyde dehydrogenase